MCGIAGIVTRNTNLDPQQIIKDMTRRVRHRGPDDEGFYVRDRVALGHRRLSILDLSPAGHQPMASADGRYVITYNGEIYNYIELRAELEAEGAQFRSNTDTEVILAAYAAWGRSCLSRFNGMWAFAIHDQKNDALFAARDRFGIKPFYYVMTDRCFAFASEIRQLLPLLSSVSANPRIVSEFLLTGVLVDSDETFFAGVRSLPAGHWLSYPTATGKCGIERYYRLLDQVRSGDTHPEAEQIADFRGALNDAVRLRMRSDVRVGTCLSGGLDSSSIALSAGRMHGTSSSAPFSAITAISEDPRNSEEPYARAVVQAGGLNWITTRPGYDDFRAILPWVVEHQEEPFGSPSICMQTFVMRAAREAGIVVLLDGQGGDETLLGYERYYAAHCLMLWRTQGVRELLRAVQQTRLNSTMTATRLAAYGAFELLPYARHLHYRRRSRYLAYTTKLPDWVNEVSTASFDIRRLQALEIETMTLPSLLRYEDKNSMGFSIEARLPFLDYRLVEKSVALAPEFKIRNGWTKWILRQSMSDILPHGIAWRRDKIGFAAPTELWLARHLEHMIEAIRGSALLKRFCDFDRMINRYGALDRNSQWRLYSLALWEKTFGAAA